MKRSRPSVLDTKETFLQFSKNQQGSDTSKNDWFRSLYRYLNLRLADALESTDLADDVEVNKTIRNLRFCGSLSLVEHQEDGSGKVVGVSKKCRNKFCHICNRQRSTKLSKRLIKLISDETIMSDNYRFYFLTLTLKHDDTTRNYNYFQELKDYQNKLFRSKVWRTVFGDASGMIQSFENSLNGESYHLHSHNMVYAQRIKIPIKEAEQMIRDKWLKLTGDSMMIRLDLIGKNLKEDQDSFIKPILELFKYSTKMSIKDGDMFANRRLAEWVRDSKGKNFVNARGKLRGLQITSAKSELDEKHEVEYQHEHDHYFERTINLKYNHSHKKKYHKDERKEILNDVYLEKISTKYKADLQDPEILNLLQYGFDDKDLDRIVGETMRTSEKTREAVRSVSEFDIEFAESARRAKMIQGMLFQANTVRQSTYAF